MRRLPLALTLLSLLVGSACHPLACWHPSDLPTDKPLELSASGEWPREEVEVLIGEMGVPHIYGSSEPDLAYALGFMHARDRLFQVITLRAAALGRLTEIFGEDLLSTDQELRILTYKLDEQTERMSERSRALVEAYCAGLNHGAEVVGKSAEMSLLGLELEPFTPRDVVAVARLQAWDLSAGMSEELARVRILNRLAEGDPRLAALLAPTPSEGVPVVTPAEHSGAQGFVVPRVRGEPERHEVKQEVYTRAPRRLTRRAKQIRKSLGIGVERGASNVWAVSGEHTEHGHAVVAHDPHLSHRGPGVFYMVHLETPEWTIAGGTFPGIPAVLIGHGDHVAWGIPVSNADSQDLVRITPYQGRDDLYLLDGAPQNYGRIVQRYQLGSGADAPVYEEEWKTTVFGPVLPPGYDHLVDEGDTFALMWTGFDPMGTSSRLLESFWSLAQADNVEEATAALQDFTSPPMSLGMAFTDGTIAYRLSGDIPLRRSDEPTTLPRDGRTRDGGWRGRLPPEYKPQLTNPARGYLVAANQRVVDADGPQAAFVGLEGASPHRAQRIHERLAALLEGGHKATTEEILAIQQDVESVEARLLAPALAAACPSSVEGHPEERVKGFCDALSGFDAKFTKDTLGGLPYTWLWDRVRREVLIAHFGEDLAGQIGGQSFVAMALQEAVLAEHGGAQSPLLDDPATGSREGLAGFVARAAKPVLDALVARAGGNPSDWRWGRLHTLKIRSPLASAPAIGFLFETSPREEAGCPPCVRSERGTPIYGGAALRNIGEMSDPPVVRLVNDSGNSGHFGHRHLEDQAPLWSEGKPFQLALPRADVEAKLEGWLKIKPD